MTYWTTFTLGAALAAGALFLASILGVACVALWQRAIVGPATIPPRPSVARRRAKWIKRLLVMWMVLTTVGAGCLVAWLAALALDRAFVVVLPDAMRAVAGVCGALAGHRILGLWLGRARTEDGGPRRL